MTEAVADYGFYYAPDPSSQIACSIGGNIAENSGGVHCLKYGTTTNNVLGLEAATLREILKAVMGTVGLGFLAQQGALGVRKAVLPGLGGVIGAPLVYGFTYGIGCVMDLYFKRRRQDGKASDADLVAAFRRGKEEGERERQD